MKEKLLNRKKIFNHESMEEFEQAKVIGGNPDGIFNFNQTPHEWAGDLYDKMLARTWFPAQVKLTKDAINYVKLTKDEKRAYDLVLAQLIANDSLQTNQLMDRVNSYITSPIVNACLARQTFEESLHSKSYAVMGEDICKDTKRIYSMHRHDEELRLKNKAVEDMYETLYKGNILISAEPSLKNNIKKLIHKLKCNIIGIEYKPTKKEILLIFVANQILEELVFPGGFVVMHALEHKMPGSSEMIAEIQKDETLSHVELFKNIFRTVIHEEFKDTIPTDVVIKSLDMVKNMTEAEKRWTKYISKGLTGFSEQVIDIFIEEQANSVCKNLGLPLLYERQKNNPLKKLLISHLKGGDMESRTNFFEKNVVDYSKGTLEIDF